MCEMLNSPELPAKSYPSMHEWWVQDQCVAKGDHSWSNYPRSQGWMERNPDWAPPDKSDKAKNSKDQQNQQQQQQQGKTQVVK